MKQLAAFFLLAMSTASLAQSYSGGDGSSGNPFQIANLTDLQYLSEHASDWNLHFVQTADIDASSTSSWNSGSGFIPIGNVTNKFTGSYNGQSHQIEGLFIERTSTDHIGLFGYTSSVSTVSNLTLVNALVSGHDYVGILIGYVDDDANVTSCGSSGSVTGNAYVGGLIGLHLGATTTSYSTAAVTGYTTIGGLMGDSEYATVTYCYATGNVTETSNVGWVGGLIGYNNFLVSNCYATGNVVGSGDLHGGLIGSNQGGSIFNCYSIGNVGPGTSHGGLIGENTGTVTASFWDTQTSGQATSAGGTGHISNNLKTTSTFTMEGWDFNTVPIWKLSLDCPNNGYPIFNTQATQNKLPVDDPADVRACTSYELPALTNGDYYTGSGGTGSMLSAGATISSTQTLYAASNNSGCINENSFLITIFDCIQLDGASCNSTLSSMGSAINCETVPGATRYRFKVTHSGTSYEAGTTQNNNYFAMSYFVSSPVKYGTTYNVQASAEVGGLWMPFENVCTVTTPATRLTNASSGITLNSLSDALYSEAVAGATNYRYEIRKASDNSFVSMSTRGAADNLFRMSWVSGAMNGTVYKIRVSAYVGSSWQAFGPSREVTTPLITKLAAASCGITIEAMSDALYSDPVAGATNYRYEIRKASDNSLVSVATRGTADNLFRMSWISGSLIQVNTDYQIRVAPYVGGVWKDYGSSCTVHTTLLTKLAVGSCSGSFLDLNNFMYCEAVAGATNYRYEIRSSPDLTLLAVAERGSSDNSYRLSWRPEIELSKAYRVKVAAYVGGTWQPFGPECTIFTYGSMAKESDNGQEFASEMLNKENVLRAFPNPSNGSFTVHANTPGEYILTNELGQLVQTIMVGENGKAEVEGLSQGVFFLRGENSTEKIVVQ